MKLTYLYIFILLLILITMSYIKQKEGFDVQWYNSDYFIIPLLATLLIVGPVVYLFYKYFLVNINKNLSAVA